MIYSWHCTIKSGMMRTFFWQKFAPDFYEYTLTSDHVACLALKRLLCSHISFETCVDLALCMCLLMKRLHFTHASFAALFTSIMRNSPPVLSQNTGHSSVKTFRPVALAGERRIVTKEKWPRDDDFAAKVPHTHRDSLA